MEWNEALGKEVPARWRSACLSDVVNSKFPITYGVVQPGDEDKYGVKFIRSGDLKTGEILFSQLRTISVDVSNQFKRTRLEGGEILISIVGNPGQVAIVPFLLKDANIARQVAMVKVENEDFQLFIKNQLVSEAGQKSLKEITIGSVQDVINLEDLRALKITLPNTEVLKFYRKIASTLEEHMQQKFLEIQNLTELKELLLSKLAKVE
jgi:type I restriction enzyme S subunit